MRPVDFQEANITLSKPESMTDEQCAPIRAWYGITPDGQTGFTTLWMPNKEDIEAINRGEGIYVRSLGNTFQPLAMFTFNENGEPNF